MNILMKAGVIPFVFEEIFILQSESSFESRFNVIKLNLI